MNALNELILKEKDPKSFKRSADVVIDVLRQYGVKKAFGIPGGAIAPVFDALLDAPDIELTMCRHENSALFAASAYARTTDELPVVLVTSGPGILNCLTGLASAFLDGMPILVLVGEVARTAHGKGASQDGSSHGLDIVGMTRHITKYAAEVIDPAALPGMFSRAIRTSFAGGRGPTLLTLPLDVLRAPNAQSRLHSAGVQLTSRPEAMALSHAALALRASRRGLIFAGSGCRSGHTHKHLVALAERLQMPVMTTPKGKGVFPESHPLALGVYGMGGHSSADDYVKEGIDTLLVLGSSMLDINTHGWTHALRPSQCMIQIDVDAAKIGRTYPANIGIASSCEEAVTELLPLLPDTVSANNTAAQGIVRHRFAPPAHGVSPDLAMEAVQRLLPEDTLFISDIGEHMLFALHYLKIDRPDAFQIQLGLGSMASGIAGALGVQMAHPKRTVACICGDGGALMSLGDFAVAATYHQPIVYVIFNDSRYGMVYNGDSKIFGRSHAYDIEGDRLGPALCALGLQVHTIKTLAEFNGLAERVAARTGPLVLDIHIARNVCLPNTRLNTLANNDRN